MRSSISIGGSGRRASNSAGVLDQTPVREGEDLGAVEMRAVLELVVRHRSFHFAPVRCSPARAAAPLLRLG
jgi:hypothetical protein